MTIFLASDHAGFQLKEEIRGYLVELGYNVKDLGPNRLDSKDDYPDYIIPAAKQVAENPDRDKAVVFGGSGEGEAIAANRFSGVRAAVWYGKNDKIITLSREHNNANMLAIGARFVDADEAKHAVSLWLKTDFSEDERHRRRLGKIENI